MSAAVHAVSKGHRTDVAFESTGNPTLPVGQLGALRKHGRLLVTGSSRGPTTLDLHDHCTYRSISIIGAHNRLHHRHATPEEPWTPRRPSRCRSRGQR